VAISLSALRKQHQRVAELEMKAYRDLSQENTRRWTEIHSLCETTYVPQPQQSQELARCIADGAVLMLSLHLNSVLFPVVGPSLLATPKMHFYRQRLCVHLLSVFNNTPKLTALGGNQHAVYAVDQYSTECTSSAVLSMLEHYLAHNFHLQIPELVLCVQQRLISPEVLAWMRSLVGCVLRIRLTLEFLPACCGPLKLHLQVSLSNSLEL
jgi:hypothetical protein